jgi:cytochrome c biogenesis protein CcmG/thiol:disulfide interchange protein DsbE
MMRFLMPVLIALLLAACEGGAPKLNTGVAAPAFSAARLDGSTARFPDDFRGKPVIIRFWAEWCRYCESEMKAIDRVYQNRRAQGLEVLAVNAGQDRETVAAFIKKIGVSYPALLDETSAIARQYGVVGLPTTYFVGADGIIKTKVVGEADEATFDKLAGELR